MALRLLAACTVLLSGCTCGIALCNVSSDCDVGATCDAASGVCVFDPDAVGGGSTALLTFRVPSLPARTKVPGAVVEDVPAAWQRSERIFLWLEASDPLTDRSLKVGGVEAVEGAPGSCVEPCANHCYCFEADLSKPALPGLRGSFPLVGSGLDPSGKRATTTGTLNVTRVAWRRALGQTIRATPAIGADGTVYLGTSGGAASRSGSLFAIAADGHERWSKPMGRIEASVLISSTGQLFVGSVSTNAMVTALSPAGIQLAQCMLPKEAQLEASPAAIPLGAAFYANNTTDLIAIRPGQNPECESQATSADVRYPDSLVAVGASIFYVDEKPNVFRYDLIGGDWLAYTQGQWPGAPTIGYRNLGLAVAAGGKLVGAGAMQSGGAVFQAASSGSFKFDFGFAPPRVAGSARGPVVASDGLVLVGTPAGLAAVSGMATQVGAGDRIANTPVLGEGGRLYALAENGALSEWSYAEGKPLRSWSATLVEGATGPAFEASPALDCARTADGALAPGRPGVLYAAARGGTLYAITVDARGIDATAQWPKYQKDPRNSGSGDTRLQEFACP